MDNGDVQNLIWGAKEKIEICTNFWCVKYRERISKKEALKSKQFFFLNQRCGHSIGGSTGDAVSLLGDESLFQHTVTGTAAGPAGAAMTAMVVRKEVRLRVGREHLSEKLYCKVQDFFYSSECELSKHQSYTQATDK